MCRNITVSNIFRSGSVIFFIFFLLVTFVYSQSEIKDVVNILIQEMKDENPTVRRRAARQLEEMNDTNAVEPLIVALKDKNIEIRRLAARVLGEISDGRAVETLMAALKDTNFDIIIGAYRFFIRKGDPGTEDVLIIALFTRGDDWMAQDFLNSGNSRLEKAGREWAASRGYKISSIPSGAAGPRWGSTR